MKFDKLMLEAHSANQRKILQELFTKMNTSYTGDHNDSYYVQSYLVRGHYRRRRQPLKLRVVK